MYGVGCENTIRVKHEDYNKAIEEALKIFEVDLEYFGEEVVEEVKKKLKNGV